MQPDPERERDEERRRGLLEELKGLFGPAFGPALEAYGRSFAERISQDASFRTEVADRFERGRALGGFPGLDAAIGDMTYEERDSFFRRGWTEVALPVNTIGEKSWDGLPWEGDLEAYREDLYGGMAYAFTDLRHLFHEWLEELLRVGYYGMREASDLPLKRQASELSHEPRQFPLYGEAYPIRPNGSRPTLWLSLDGPRTDSGYHQIAITDRPLRTDAAIFTATTCLEGREIDIPLLCEVLPTLLPGRGESFSQTWARAMGREPEEFRRKLREVGEPASLDYVLHLLRHHRGGFDLLAPSERLALISETCVHINDLLATVKKTLTYAECGTPGKGIVSVSRTTGRDIESVVLRDVLELTYREIGARLGIPTPKDISYKGDHPTVRKMVGRGRKLLCAALGEEGWLLHAESMKADMTRWQSMSDTRREVEAVAEYSDLTYEEALEQVGEEERRRNNDNV